jgi:hypothetical protein
MYISNKSKCQLSFNWHLNLSKVCVTQPRTTSYIRVFFLGIYYLFSGEEKIIDTKEISETVNRRPDDVMAKRGGTKIYIDGQNTTQKTKDSVIMYYYMMLHTI